MNINGQGHSDSTKLSRSMTKTNKITCAASNDSEDQPEHLSSLISLCCLLEEGLGP